jgi:hypothetical protein
LAELENVLKHVDVLMVNDSEARQLSGQFSLVRAAKEIMKMGPKYIIIKKGEHGRCFFMKTRYSRHLLCPWKMFLIPLVLATLLPAGSLDILLKPKTFQFENMKTAIIVGSAMASYCVEKFGTARLIEITAGRYRRKNPGVCSTGELRHNVEITGQNKDSNLIQI